ncbi:hypothetical protein [Actinomadura algeriensis]|uniref:Uncharacterized protein n=1 Tax=Actinomadura algeriensis TaxID=1679523 RepID=A0ABR9JKR3_9ACTN|nr:hypothetical protein [Actinomadura algeriensis]MBE1531144.1 hypothetical protein [Actinomadura algeriensis]
MTPPRELPRTLDGWRVDIDSRGVWIATRRESLTRTQAEYGVPLQLLAGTLGELELKAIAADLHAGIVAASERMVARMLERQDEHQPVRRIRRGPIEPGTGIDA